MVCFPAAFADLERYEIPLIIILGKMADTPVVLCDVLCFVVNKFGKTTLKTMKSALTDFYTSEVLANAKCQLLKDIDNLNLSTKRPHIPLRRDGDGRLEREVSDIIQMLTFLDENKALDSLPTYASTNPDNMPSLRLYDSDLNIIMRKLSDMSVKLEEFGSALTAIFHEINELQVCKTVPAPLRMTAQSSTEARYAINNVAPDPNTAQPSSAVNFAGNSTETETRPPVIPDWARVASTPCENRFAVLAAAGDETAACNDDFTVVSRQRRTKRARQQTSPRPPGNQQQQQQPQQQQQQKTQKRSLFGTAANANVNNVGSTVISAAKKLRKKAVFCIDNVNTSCSVNDMCKFVSDLSIEVVSCFEVKPRRRRNENEGEADRKAFRLCIYDNDRDRLMDAAVWPDSVMVSQWFFKAAADDANRRQQVISSDNERRPVRPATLSATGSADNAATISGAASSNAAVDCSITASTSTVNTVNADDTIIANYCADIMDTSSIDPNGVC